MEGSPYRAHGPLPPTEGYWTRRRVMAVAFSAVLALAFVAMLVAARVDAVSASPRSVQEPQGPPQTITQRMPGPTENAPLPEPPPSAAALTSQLLEAVVSRHRAEVRAACVHLLPGERVLVANETVAVTIDEKGKVTNAFATGDSPVVGRCLEDQIRTWVFPATGATTMVNIPFRFVSR